MTVDVLLIGTGSLAKAFCYAMAKANNLAQIKVVILGRSIEKASKISIVAETCSAIALSNVSFSPEEVSFESEADLEKKISKFAPKIVLQMSSPQSPWEFGDHNNKWSKLVNYAGFGLTVPLQSFVTLKVAKIIKNLKLQSLLVNACYPDLVNPLLKCLGYDVTCGVGNVSILAAAIRSRSEAYKKADLKILGHHLHLTKRNNLPPDYNNPRIWVDNIHEESADQSLERIRNVKDQELNQLTGLISAQIIMALLNTYPTFYNLPGPNGLPGGYPAIVSSSGVVLNLPSAIGEDEAIAWNIECSKYDGASIDKNGFVRFNDLARDSLKLNSMKCAEGFYCEDIDKVYKEFASLRAILRL